MISNVVARAALAGRRAVCVCVCLRVNNILIFQRIFVTDFLKSLEIERMRVLMDILRSSIASVHMAHHRVAACSPVKTGYGLKCT